MIDIVEQRFTAACEALKIAEREYAAAESRLIEARRECETAKVGTLYWNSMHGCLKTAIRS